MAWAFIGRALLGAGTVFAKDKIADWTEGTDLEQYTHQWDNPKWYDYVGGGVGGGIGGVGGTAIGEGIRGINQYQDEPDEYDYRRSIGAVLGSFGSQYAKDNDIGFPWGNMMGGIGNIANFLPDTRSQDPEVGDEEQIPNAGPAQPFQGAPYGGNQVPYTQWNPLS